MRVSVDIDNGGRAEQTKSARPGRRPRWVEAILDGFAALILCVPGLIAIVFMAFTGVVFRDGQFIQGETYEAAESMVSRIVTAISAGLFLLCLVGHFLMTDRRAPLWTRVLRTVTITLFSCAFIAAAAIALLSEL